MKKQSEIGLGAIGAVAVLSVLVAVESPACTGIRLKTKDGDTISARTMEFSAEQVSFNLIVVPRAYAYQGRTPSQTSGMAWKVQYAHAGFGPFGMPMVADGLNEKGLACSAFFFPGYAKYETVAEVDYPQTISCLDLTSWILGACATVAEVRERLPKIHVCGAVLDAWGIVPPLHYVVTDDTGASIVIEYVDGKLSIYDNMIGVITNAPAYGWHLTNLRNYIGLKAVNDPAISINGMKLEQFGQGSGAIGLPGDFTPPSRFVRAAFLVQETYPAKDADEGIATAFRILNQFDIPQGAIRNVQGNKVVSDTTQWTSAADLKNRRYYFHTYNNRAVRMVDLNKLDLNAPAVKSLNVQAPGKIEDISAELK
ncbi:MAG: choloylglycine hydrolase family protein [Kiritimatiellia bacterium]|jgi:choloylglycine hydrolase